MIIIYNNKAETITARTITFKIEKQDEMIARLKSESWLLGFSDLKYGTATHI